LDTPHPRAAHSACPAGGVPIGAPGAAPRQRGTHRVRSLRLAVWAARQEVTVMGRMLVSALPALLVLGMVGGCARQSPAPSASSALAAAPATPPPAGSKLAGITQGMRPEEVQKIAGAPTTIRPYLTGKAFIPWYFGPDG